MKKIFKNLLLSYDLSRYSSNLVKLLGTYKAINTFQNTVNDRSLLYNEMPVDFSDKETDPCYCFFRNIHPFSQSPNIEI